MEREKKSVKTIVFLTETMTQELESIATSTGTSKQDLIRSYIAMGLYSQKKADEVLKDLIAIKGGLNV